MGNDHLVFVYGTLKRGEPNEAWMSDAARGKSEFVRGGRTVVKYPLTIGTPYNIPLLLDVPGRGNQIVGEIYKVDDAKLSHLDELEDYPRLYKRRLEKIQTDSGEVEALMYMMKQHKPEHLEMPTLAEYRSNGSHGRPYQAQYIEAITDGKSGSDHHPKDLFEELGLSS